MPRLPFFYSDALLKYDMGPQHPLRPKRLKMTYELLKSYSAFNERLECIAPSLATREEVEAVHSPDFIDMLERLDNGEPIRGMQRFGFGGGDNPIFPGICAAALLYTGASSSAAQAVLDGSEVAFSISGGLHHAHYAQAAGFCVLNDCAVAMRRLRQKFERVAYVDIDVHHGDGVQELFYDDPTCLTISLHETGRTLFPGTGDTGDIGIGAGSGYSVNLPFAMHTTDEIWISAWREAALPILEAFDPGAIVLQMGTDTHELDPLAHLSLTAQGWLEAVKDVHKLGKPIVAIGGGGYNPTTVPRMWALAISELAGLNLPDQIPANYAFHNEFPATLTDKQLPLVNERDREKARLFAKESIREVKECLFSYHNLR